MIGVPPLFEKDLRTRKFVDNMIPVTPLVAQEWVAMEMIPGADVRVTVRDHSVVRLEVVQKPSEKQRKVGIMMPWYRDAQEGGPDYWLHKAVQGTDVSGLPDGEWAGEAIGENINRNPLDIEGHRIVFSSVFPWREVMPDVEVPPVLGRVPIGFEDLRFWLATTTTKYPHCRTPGLPIDGVVLWYHETPMAQAKIKDFPKIVRAPNPAADLPEVFDTTEVFDGSQEG